MKKSFNLFICSFLLFINFQCYGNETIRLYVGTAPGSESWDWSETQKISGKKLTVTNVTVPTLTVFEADKALANGTAVIICPGGGFLGLAIENEGSDVAKWLNDRGITAFVLKYRLRHIDSETNQIDPKIDRDTVQRLAINDAKVAVSYVRKHREKWGLSEGKIGVMGFSAGGSVATGLAYTYDASCRPDFAALIYPSNYECGEVPKDAPPVFIAVAADDPLKLTSQSVDIFTKWYNAGKSAELHIYRKGGHGFGMKKKNIPTNSWIDRFYEWYMAL